MSLRVTALKEKITQMEVVEDFESRPHKAVSFVAEREKKEIQEWNEQKRPKVLLSLQWKEQKEKGREEEEPDEGKKIMGIRK